MEQTRQVTAPKCDRAPYLEDSPLADSLPFQREIKPSWKMLFEFTRWSHAAPLATALVASAAVAGFKASLSVILGQIFEIIAEFGTGSRSSESSMAGISRWALILVGLGVGNSIAHAVFLTFWIIFGELQAQSARHRMFNCLVSKEMAWFDVQEEGISSLLIRMQTQTRELQLATSQILGFLVSEGMTAVASLCVAFYFSWKLTLVILTTIPVSIVILSLATRKIEPAIQMQKKYLATASKHATASLMAIDLVKVFGGYDQELKRYLHFANLASNHYLVQALCNSIQLGYVSFWLILTFVVGFWYGAALIDAGLSPGSVMSTFYAVLTAFQGAEALIPHWLVFSKGMSGGKFLSSVMPNGRRKGLPRKMGGMLRPQICAGTIELRDVSFSYPSNPNRIALNQCSFSFPAGEVTFIVGKSGSGKSTVGSLISNFYQPSTGDILIDGRSMRIIQEDWLRENIMLLQQSSVLFNESFQKNVAFGHRSPDFVSSQAVTSVCDDVLLQSTIAGLPQGLDTNVGPEGHNLSGGQKQRLALARARLRNPPVLVLDEVTSGLDQVNRVLVMESLRCWRRNKTTVIITHDISQILPDDFVYVMDDAGIVEEGFKRDLIQKPEGFFASFDSPGSQEGLEIEINVLSPTPPDASPITPIIPSSSGLMADLFLRGLENHSSRYSYGGGSRRTSFGAAASYAAQMKAERSWASPANVPARSSAVPRDVELEDLDDERKRFSRFVTERFILNKELERNDLRLPFSRSSQAGAYLRLEDHPRRHSIVPGPLSAKRPSYKVAGGPSPFRDKEFTIQEESLSVRSSANPENSSWSSGNHHHDEEDALPNSAPFREPEVYINDKEPKTKDSIFTTLKTVWPILGIKDRITLVCGILATVVGAAATPAFAYCFAQLLGIMTTPGNKSQRGMKWAVSMLAIAIVNGVGIGGGRYLVEKAAQSWVSNIRKEALRRILLQPRSWFNKSKNSPSRINECLDRNAEEMRNIVGRFVPIMTGVLTMISISLLWAFVVSWKLTLVALAPVPLVFATIQGFGLITGKWEGRCNEAAEEASASLTEVLLNIRVVRALALERYFRIKYESLVDAALNTGLKRSAFSSPLFGIYQSAGYFLTALVFYYATTMLVGDRELGVAEIMQVVNLLIFGIGMATSMLSSLPQLVMAQATASQMLGFARLPTQPPEGHQGRKILESPLPIRFDNLRFSYSPRGGEEVLRGVSFEIQPGRCTAIVGHSGCGKSTIISLILALYPPTNTGLNPRSSSSLTFAGFPFSEVDIHRLRSAMAYVAQFPFLFPGTISENIIYGLPIDSPYRHMRDIQHAAQAAGVDEWIDSLPQGYHTRVGDGGQALSGGQAQRLGIARALVRRPRLLVMDEPTSALDAESAATIRETIKGLKSNRDMGIVVVTHSSEMMSMADRVIMLGQGGVVLQEGGFSELLAEGGPFLRLVKGIGSCEGEASDEDSPLQPHR
ncbi:unnamed protein product [Clonostachys rosea f. rosea IK726]|uniref:Uncharacterized protein n=2 Tax=Bionectria ochroleuca TaxID=29856 RepID=A0A0B7JYL8_BIOOC|nr:unnamed protein product [Clonostachys rosea f. rosea IK726]